MANLSKEIFNRNFTQDTPCSFLHPWSDKCSDGMKVLILHMLIGTVKFFGPVYMLKIIVEWKKLNQKSMESILIGYFRTITYGVTFGMLLFGSMCLITNFKKSYYNVLVAGCMGGLSIILETRQNQIINGILFFNQVLESALNILTHKRYVTRSRGKETLAFMVISSCVMYLFKKYYLPPAFFHLWFHPTKSVFEHYEQKPYAPCTHKFPCKTHAYRGAYKYFCIGYIVELLRNLSQMAIKKQKLSSILVNKKNLLFGLFFASYAFMYRNITCHLMQQDREESANHALVAGFLAGSTYYIQPNIHMPIIGITTILQLLWRRFRKNVNLPKSIPFGVISFCFSSAVLVHMRFHVHDYCPRYTNDMLSMVTNGLGDEIYNNMWYILREADKSLSY